MGGYTIIAAPAAVINTPAFHRLRRRVTQHGPADANAAARWLEWFHDERDQGTGRDEPLAPLDLCDMPPMP